jgi:hypothetical protein
MSRKPLPKAGDKITIDRKRLRENGERVHPVWAYRGSCNQYNSYGTIKIEGRECYCGGAEYEMYEDEMVVEQIVFYADNSIEAEGYAVSDGKKWRTMLDAPHGDACF